MTGFSIEADDYYCRRKPTFLQVDDTIKACPKFLSNSRVLCFHSVVQKELINIVHNEVKVVTMDEV